MAKQQPLQFGAQLKPYRNKPYEPDNPNPFMVSRSKLDLFKECPRCFYLDQRMGIKRPPGFPFNLNSAVDTLLKKEFDIHRAKGSAHPLMDTYHIDAVPFAHDLMDNWRENFVGVQYLHQPTNLMITGAVDDIWQYPNGDLVVVDYKATSKNGEVSLDAPWQITYKRQMEVYQWLLRRNDFPVANTGYFVYCNGRTDVKAFDAKLEFDIKVIPYEGNDSWIENAIKDVHACLNSNTLPPAPAACEYCSYAGTRMKKSV